MKPWRETVALPHPIRQVNPIRAGFDGAGELAIQERERRAFEAGRLHAEKMLREQMLQQRSDLLQLQNGVFHSLQKMLPDLAGECESLLIDVALQAAQKIVQDIPITVNMVEAAIKEALAQVEETSELLIFLNPSDLELLTAMNAPVLMTTVGGERVKFEASHEVSRGGCIIHTRFGLVDARRETKLERLKKAVLE